VLVLLAALAAAGCVGVRIGTEGFEVPIPTGSATREPASTAELEAARAEVVARINAARRRAGLAPLAAHPALDRAAQRHAADMAARGFYSHDNPEGLSPRDRAGRAGYGPARLIGENIARGARSPEQAVELWLDSRAHRKILLEASFSETGVGIAAGRHRGQTRLFWVQVFGSPKRSG
jgi:uncharacterized protein YkwD